MCVWSHRPRFLHLGLFFAGYVLGGAFATALGIVPGTNISIWPPGGLFTATLILTSLYSWPWWMLAGCLAELFGQLLWCHSPLPAAFLMYVGNACRGDRCLARQPVLQSPGAAGNLARNSRIRRTGRWNCANS